MRIHMNKGAHYADITLAHGERRPRTESEFWHMVKRTLQRDFMADVIKKEMVKDGHMVSGGIYYVRTRKWGKSKYHVPGEYALWDSDYQIRSIVDDLRRGTVVTVRLEW